MMRSLPPELVAIVAKYLIRQFNDGQFNDDGVAFASSCKDHLHGLLVTPSADDEDGEASTTRLTLWNKSNTAWPALLRAAPEITNLCLHLVGSDPRAVTTALLAAPVPAAIITGLRKLRWELVNPCVPELVPGAVFAAATGLSGLRRFDFKLCGGATKDASRAWGGLLRDAVAAFSDIVDVGIHIEANAYEFLCALTAEGAPEQPAALLRIRDATFRDIGQDDDIDVSHLSRLAGVRRLDIERCACEVFADELHRLTELESLRVDSVGDMSLMDVQNAACLSGLTRLTELRLTVIVLDDEDPPLEIMDAFLRHLPTSLVRLDLSVGSDDLIAVRAVTAWPRLAEMPGLRHLALRTYLHAPGLGEEPEGGALRTIARLSRLETLSLDHALDPASETAAALLFEGIRHMTGLRRLELTNCGIGSSREHAPALASVLVERLPLLEEISLLGNKLEESDVRVLRRAWRGMGTLRKADLRWNYGIDARNGIYALGSRSEHHNSLRATHKRWIRENSLINNHPQYDFDV